MRECVIGVVSLSGVLWCCVCYGVCVVVMGVVMWSFTGCCDVYVCSLRCVLLILGEHMTKQGSHLYLGPIHAYEYGLCAAGVYSVACLCAAGFYSGAWYKLCVVLAQAISKH